MGLRSISDLRRTRSQPGDSHHLKRPAVTLGDKRRLVVHRRGDGVGVSAGLYVLVRCNAAIHADGLSRAGSRSCYRVGSDGVAPVGGAAGIGEDRVVQEVSAALHLPRGNGGAGGQTLVEADVVRRGVGAGHRHVRRRVQLHAGVVSEGQVVGGDQAGSLNGGGDRHRGGRGGRVGGRGSKAESQNSDRGDHRRRKDSVLHDEESSKFNGGVLVFELALL